MDTNLQRFKSATKWWSIKSGAQHTSKFKFLKKLGRHSRDKFPKASAGPSIYQEENIIFESLSRIRNSIRNKFRLIFK